MHHLPGTFFAGNGGKLLLLLVSEVMRLADGFCNTFATDFFNKCPQVLQVGESCEASCPAGLHAIAQVSCQDGGLFMPSCLEINTSTTSSTTASATSTSSSSSISSSTTTSGSQTATTSTTGSSTSSKSSSSTSSITTTGTNTTSWTWTTTTWTTSWTSSNATELTSTTQFDGVLGSRCVVASMRWTSCPRYMLHMERCDALCESPQISVGHFTCLAGRFFGSSGCLEPAEATNLAWRGLLLAAAVRFGFNSLRPVSQDELLESLRRSLAVCIGVSARSMVRLRAVDRISNNESGEVLSSEVEFEVTLENELLNETEVATSILRLGDPSSPVSLLFRNMLKGYFDIQVTWVDVVMSPLSYAGSLQNFTASSASVASPTEADPDGTTTTVVSGLVLSVAVVPVAAWVRLVLAEQNAGDELGAGAPELRKNGRPKRKSKSRSGPASLDAG